MTFQIVSAMCSVYLLPAERVRVLFGVVAVVTLRAGSVSTVHSGCLRYFLNVTYQGHDNDCRY